MLFEARYTTVLGSSKQTLVRSDNLIFLMTDFEPSDRWAFWPNSDDDLSPSSTSFLL